jgi:hypothetical protein
MTPTIKNAIAMEVPIRSLGAQQLHDEHSGFMRSFAAGSGVVEGV